MAIDVTVGATGPAAPAGLVRKRTGPTIERFWTLAERDARIRTLRADHFHVVGFVVSDVTHFVFDELPVQDVQRYGLEWSPLTFERLALVLARYIVGAGTIGLQRLDKIAAAHGHNGLALAQRVRELRALAG